MEMPATLEQLLGHDDFVRRVAHNLIFDENQVDEVVQKTWLAALEKRPVIRNSARGWLARVTANFAHQSRRDSERIERREHAAAKPEALPSAAEIVERESIRREVMEAVLSLEEPYQSTILSRFYQGLLPQEIAEQTQTPLPTVNTRLRRGLEKLRGKLDANHNQDRRAWCLALIPLALPNPTTSSSPDSTAARESAKAGFNSLMWIKIAASLLIIGGVWFILSGTAQRSETHEEGAAHENTSIPTLKTAQLPEPSSAPIASDLKDKSEPARVAASTPIDDSWRFHGIVQDPDKKPIAGASLEIYILQGKIHYHEKVQSQSDGNYEFTIPRFVSAYSFTPVNFDISVKSKTHANARERYDFENFPSKENSIVLVSETHAGGGWGGGDADGESGASISLKNQRHSIRLESTKQSDGRESIKRDFTLAKCSYIRGKLLVPQSDYTIAPNVNVFRITDEGKTLISPSYRSDGGLLEIQIDQPGIYNVQVKSWEHGEADQDSIAVGENEQVEIPDLIFHTAGKLEGFIRLPDGTPVTREFLLAMREGGKPDPKFGFTNLEGHFSIAEIERGFYRFIVHESQVISPKQPTELLPGSSLNLILNSCAISLNVQDVQGHEVPGAATEFVYLREPNDSEMSAILKGEKVSSSNSKTDLRSGSDPVILVPPGNVIIATTEAYGAKTVENRFVIPREDYRFTRTVVLEALSQTPSATLELSVFESDGKPAADFIVVTQRRFKILKPEPSLYHSGKDGHISLKLFPGSYQIEVSLRSSAKDGEAMREKIEIGEGENLVREIRLPRD